MNLDRNYDKKMVEMCGSAVVAFINAKTTNEACLCLISKIKAYYRYSTHFIKAARHNFPFLEHISENLDEWQRKIIDLYFLCKTDSSLIENAVWNLMLLYEDYDLKGDELILRREFDYKLIRIRLGDIDKNYSRIQQQLLKACSDAFVTEQWRNDCSGFELNELLFNFRKHHQLFSEVSQKIPPEKENEIKSFFDNKLLRVHSNIHYKQAVIRLVINRAINGIRLDRCHAFNELIDNYRGSRHNFITILPDGNLKLVSLKRDESFFQYYKPPAEQNENRDYFGVGARNLTAYMSAIDDFFVEFIKRHNNIFRFRCCTNCNKYFVSRTKRQPKFCVCFRWACATQFFLSKP
jgi:hypothetical protein